MEDAFSEGERPFSSITESGGGGNIGGLGWGEGVCREGGRGGNLDKVGGEGETRRGEAGGRRGEEGKRGDGPMCVPLPLSPTSGFSTLL